jgi:CHASE3 domain sensor protein
MVFSRLPQPQRGEMDSTPTNMDGGTPVVRAAPNRLALHWLNLPLRVKGLIVLAIPFAALVVGVMLVYLQDRQEDQARQHVRHAIEVDDALEHVLLLVVEAETGVRGYLLSGQPAFLAPDEAAEALLPGAMARLEELIQDPGQIARFAALMPLVEHRLASLATTRGYGETADQAPVAVPAELLTE